MKRGLNFVAAPMPSATASRTDRPQVGLRASQTAASTAKATMVVNMASETARVER